MALRPALAARVAPLVDLHLLAEIIQGLPAEQPPAPDLTDLILSSWTSRSTVQVEARSCSASSPRVRKAVSMSVTSYSLLVICCRSLHSPSPKSSGAKGQARY